jgi:predicted DNA-binding protein (UPF0251 family)
MDKDQTMAHGHARRGRPRIKRNIEFSGPVRCYVPQCNIPGITEKVALMPEELELLRLVDYEGLEQEEAASVMGISRRTAWRDLHTARHKVVDAMLHGKQIEHKTGAPGQEERSAPRKRVKPAPGAGYRISPPRFLRRKMSSFIIFIYFYAYV